MAILKRIARGYLSFFSAINWLSVMGVTVSGIGVVLMTFLVTLDVISRTVFNVSVTWAGEMTWYLLCFGIFFSLAGALMEELHVRALFIVTRFPRKVQDTLRIITSILAMIGVGFLIHQGWLKALQAYQSHQVSLTPLSTPLWPIMLTIPIGGFLFFLQWIVRLTLYIRALRGEEVKELERIL